MLSTLLTFASHDWNALKKFTTDISSGLSIGLKTLVRFFGSKTPLIVNEKIISSRSRTKNRISAEEM